MANRITYLSVVALLASQTTGCAQGQTGGEIEIDGGHEGTDELGDGCVDSESQEINADVDTGFDVDSWLTGLAGEYDVSGSWSRADGFLGGAVVVSPEAGTTEFSVKIELVEGSARWIKRELEDNSDDDYSEEDNLDTGWGYQQCLDRATVEAKVTIQSGNSALDEELRLQFWTDDGVVSHAHIDLDPEKLSGSFDVDASAVEGVTAVRAQLDLNVAFGAISGSLAGSVESEAGDSASSASLSYARFPASDPCDDLSYLVPESDALYRRAQSLLDAHQEFSFRWSDEEETQTLKLKSKVKSICYEGPDVEGTLAMSARVETAAQLEDGTIAGTWDLTGGLTVGEQGELSSARVMRNDYLVQTFSSEEMSSVAGVSTFDYQADVYSFSFSYQVYARDQYPGSGEITLLGMTIPECLSGSDQGEEDPESDSKGGGESFGCEGLSPVEFKNAQFAETTEDASK